MNPNNSLITLNDFILYELKKFANATGAFSSLLRDIAFAAKRIHVQVNNAGIADILASTGQINVQGEEVQKLDQFANALLISTLKNGFDCCGIGSEEEQDVVIFDNEYNNNSPYVVLFDPIDGSVNIDVNVSVGTIFSIYRRLSKKGTKATIEDFLQAGKNLIAAGYIVYGSSTMLVYASASGSVNGFTLDTSIGEFCLSHKNIRMPEYGNIFSINSGNYLNFPEGIKNYIDHCHNSSEDKSKAFSLRYIGSMVSDIHRNIIKGGVFLYPPTKDKPNGKLRLMYECIPMAFIVEKSGGVATDGNNRILDIIPKKIHQRSPLYIGNKQMVEEILTYL